MDTAPREAVRQAEATAAVPPGVDERFAGWGVMGVTFASGHVLAMRQFPASSLGPGYRSVWHRAPGGRWTFHADVPPGQACARFFGSPGKAGATQGEIGVEWTGPDRLHVTVPGAALDWHLTVASTPATRLMNAVAAALPEAAWRNPTVLAAMGRVAGPLLRAGRLGLAGFAPNGQWFIANPRRIWAVTRSRATLDGTDLGEPGPLLPQARLGDFAIPQRGLLAIGRAWFEPFDPARHSPPPPAAR